MEDRPWLEVSDSVVKCVLSTHNTLKFCPQHQAMAFFGKVGKVELVTKRCKQFLGSSPETHTWKYGVMQRNMCYDREGARKVSRRGDCLQ